MIRNTRALFLVVTPFIVLPVFITVTAHAENAAQSTSVVEANTRFAFKLFHALTTASSDRNMLLAPTGVSLTFALLDNGADAEARKEIENAFELRGLSLDQINRGFSELRALIQLATPKMTKRPDWMTPAEWRTFQTAPPNGTVIADSIWLNRGTPKFQNVFAQLNQRYYGADLRRFSPVPSPSLQVSRWARERTRKVVPIALSQGEKESSFVLVDVTHFHSFWAESFNQSLTKPGPFKLLSGKTKEVPLMYQGRTFHYFEADNFQAIILPYGDTSMYVFLPSETSSLAEFERSLTPQNWRDWSSRFESRPGLIGLPRFETSTNFDVRSVLEEMGVRRPFASLDAFLPLFPVDGAKLVSARQSTSLKVDERGTEAISIGISAGVVGGVAGGLPGQPPKPFKMIVDRPFFFAIVHDRTKQLLFLGAVVEP